MDSVEELYQELILDHYQHPRSRGALEAADCNERVFNPLCGDEVEIMVKFEGDKLSNITFLGAGCSISQASASMLSEICKGKTITEITKLYEEVNSLIKDGAKEQNEETLGDMMALSGVCKFPARQRCALIAWEALMRCLKNK